MTEHEPRDPRRALDGIEPPERWDDIVERAAGLPATVGPDERVRTGRPPLLVAAVVLALAGVAGALVVATRGDDTVGVTTDPGVADLAEQVWGHEWLLATVEVPGEAPMGQWEGREPGESPVLDLRLEGRAQVLNTCEALRGPARIEGDRLVVEAVDERVTDDCVSSMTYHMGLVLVTVVRADPLVSVEDGHLVLTDGDTVLTFDALQPDPEPEVDPPEQMLARTWVFTSLWFNWGEVEVPDGLVDSVTLTVGPDRAVHLRVCSTLDGELVIDGDRLEVPAGSAGVVDDGPACDGPDGEVATELRDLLVGLLNSGPTIEVRGNDLTLNQMAMVATFVDADAPDAERARPVPDDGGPSVGEPVEPVEPVGPDPVLDAATPWIDEGASLDDPAGLWSRTWRGVRRVERGEVIDLRAPPAGQGMPVEARPVALVSVEPGLLAVSCRPMGRFRLDGSRLVRTEESWSDRGGCLEPVDERALRELVLSSPEVRIAGDRASLEGPDGTSVDLELEVDGVFWGQHGATLVEVVDDGVAGQVVRDDAGSVPVLSLASYGRVDVSACSSGSIAGQVRDGVLQVAEDWIVTAAACGSRAAAGQDTWLRRLVGSGPTVTVDDTSITLSAGADRAVFHRPR